MLPPRGHVEDRVVNKSKRIMKAENQKRSLLIHSITATVMRNRNKAMEAAKGTASLKATRLINNQKGPVSGMGELLTIWTEDQTQKCFHLSNMTAMTKAKCLCATLKEKPGPNHDVQSTAISE